MKILIVSSISPDAVDKLCEKNDVISAIDASEDRLKLLLHDREVLIFRSGVIISANVMDCAPNLRLLIRAGSGIDNLDMNYIKQRDLKFERIPEPSSRAVAELTFALMLALARNLVEADRLLRQGRWAKYELTGRLLTGKVLGIIGAGNIGSRVGELGTAWNMKVIGCVEHPSPAVAARLSEKGIRLANYSEVISTSDFLSIHVPLTESTRNMINEEIFYRMKRGSYLINLSRGGVVNEQDLLKALTQGDKLLGAALDVHQVEKEGNISPLASLHNVILTPHIGAQTTDTQYEIGERILQIVDTYDADLLNFGGNKHAQDR